MTMSFEKEGNFFSVFYKNIYDNLVSLASGGGRFRDYNTRKEGTMAIGLHLIMSDL